MKAKDFSIKACASSKLIQRFESIQFISLKIEYFANKIKEEHVNLSEEIKQAIWDDFKLKGVSHLPKKRDNNQEYSFQYEFEGFSMNNKMLFYLDTILADLKRCVDFSIKFILESHGVSTKKFSLNILLKQISSSFEGKREKYVLRLLHNYPQYIHFINSLSDWLSSLNKKRTTIMHYKTFNKTNPFSVGLTWKPGTPFTKKPEIGMPIISVFKKPIMKLIAEYVTNLDEFINRTFELRKDLIIYKGHSERLDI